MFGAARSLSARDQKTSARAVSMTGLERARLERSQQEQAETALPQPIVQQTDFAPAPEPVKSVIMPAPRPSSFKSVATATPMAASSAGNAAHLYAGPGIMLKGEIAGCDTLKVEGVVDGNASARQLVVCQGGRFLGTAEIEEAEIEGNFEGTLCVHGHLLLRSSGRISGKLSYGQIEIEKGGEIVGEVNAHGKQTQARPAPQPLVSVSNERRALAMAPVPEPFKVEQAPRYEEAPRAQPAPAAAASPTPPRPAPVPDGASKARKPLFFGRS